MGDLRKGMLTFPKWRPLKDLPNKIGKRVIIKTRTFSEFDAVVDKDDNGVHFLRLPDGVKYNHVVHWRDPNVMSSY